MNKTVLFLMLIVVTFCNAQNNDNNATALGTVNLGLHGAEFSYELPLSNSFMWENSLGLGMGSRASSNSNASYTFVLDAPVPYFKSELKYVYNRNKRVRKNRSVRNNSGNYIGLQTKYSFGNQGYFDLNETLLTEFHWGIQRSLGKRFLFNFHLGVGVLQDYNTNRAAVTPTLGINFGYKLF